MSNAADAIELIERLKSELGLKWINTERSGSDWKAKIYEQATSNTQLAVYDRKSNIQILTERRLPAIEGAAVVSVPPKSHALNHGDSHFRGGAGSCYAMSDISTLNRLLEVYFRSNSSTSESKSAKALRNPVPIPVPIAVEDKDGMDTPKLAISGNDLDAEILKSFALPHGLRLARLAKAELMPRRTVVSTTTFLRNPDVVAEVLFLAKGKCGLCKSSAPVLRRSDAQPYLEVHHRKHLADGGADSIENALAVCPNCHRKAHYG